MVTTASIHSPKVKDHFDRGVSPHWARLAVGYTDIEYGPGTIRFVVKGAVANSLSDSQINDGGGLPRDQQPWTPPLRMEVRARASHPAGELLGTAGFGFWNDPFDFHAGVAAVPPNAVWFFYASPLSDMALVAGVPGHGWKATMINSGQASPLTMLVGNWLLRIPGLNRLLFRLARLRVRAGETLLNDVDLTAWHTYALNWLPDAAEFFVDDHRVYRVANPPRLPLGFVAWVDNHAATLRPDGSFTFQHIAIPHRQWLELDYVIIETMRQ